MIGCGRGKSQSSIPFANAIQCTSIPNNSLVASSANWNDNWIDSTTFKSMVVCTNLIGGIQHTQKMDTQFDWVFFLLSVILVFCNIINIEKTGCQYATQVTSIIIDYWWTLLLPFKLVTQFVLIRLYILIDLHVNFNVTNPLGSIPPIDW